MARTTNGEKEAGKAEMIIAILSTPPSPGEVSVVIILPKAEKEAGVTIIRVVGMTKITGMTVAKTAAGGKAAGEKTAGMTAVKEAGTKEEKVPKTVKEALCRHLLDGMATPVAGVALDKRERKVGKTGKSCSILTVLVLIIIQVKSLDVEFISCSKFIQSLCTAPITPKLFCGCGKILFSCCGC